MSTEKNPKSLPRVRWPDLCAAREAVATGDVSAEALMQVALDAAEAPAAARAFVRRFDDQALAAARAVDSQHQAGAPLPPLAGLAVSVKDLFDVAGQPTTAASRALADAAPAAGDAPVVARLRAAGAALIGHTNLTEFAYSGVGINPHHGTPVNVAALAIDGSLRIPGGSSSGGASSVACGAAWAALGSDTGGSIRIPAALQGLVGFKSTQRLVPLQGSVSLSTTLDTACAITRSVRDAVVLHEVLAARRIHRRGRTLAQWRLALPQTLMLDALEPAVAEAFERALKALREAGASIEPIDLPPLAELATINAGGGFSAPEAWATHHDLLTRRGEQFDPRVARRMRVGQAMPASDYIALQRTRVDWIARMDRLLAPFDAMLSPTVPMVAPLLAPLLHDDEAFFATNGRLLRNPAVVNFLDGCALSLPCQASGQLPVGLMVWAGALQDDTVLEVAAAIEAQLAREGAGVCA